MVYWWVRVPDSWVGLPGCGARRVGTGLVQSSRAQGDPPGLCAWDTMTGVERTAPPQSSPGSGRVSSSRSGKRSSLRTTGRALRKHWPRTRPICFHRSKSLKWVANSSGACTSRSTGCSVSKKANPKRLASTLSLPGTRRNRNIWLTVKKINHQIRLRNARTLACWLELSTSHAGVHSTPHCENTCSESYSIWTCSLSQLGDLPFLLQNELSIETFFLSNF